MTCSVTNIWLIVMGAAGGLALLNALLLCVWCVKGRVDSYCKATHKNWQRKDEKGNPIITITEMDREDALRMILEQRIKRIAILLAFAALIAILTTVVVASLIPGKESKLDKQDKKANSQQLQEQPLAVS